MLREVHRTGNDKKQRKELHDMLIFRSLIEEGMERNREKNYKTCWVRNGKKSLLFKKESDDLGNMFVNKTSAKKKQSFRA